MRLWRLRDDRRKSLQVIAELAGMSTTTLWRIEQGKRALASQAEVVALAKALQIAPDELNRLPIPAPANGHTDSAVAAVDHALLAVSHHLPGGQVLPVDALRSRVTATVDALCRCDQEREVGAALPDLIRDLHTTIAAGRDLGELLPLAAWLHTQATASWLRLVGASVDLRGQAVMLARQAAQEHGTAASMGLVAAAGASVALAKGAFDIAQAGLDAVSMPTNSAETMQLAGLLALRRSVVAAVDKRRGDVDAPLEYAGELAARTGEGNAFGLGFGPTNVGCFRLQGLVEAGDHEQAVSVAESLHPEAQDQVFQAYYWCDYGRALARLRGRNDDAVRAFRRAELISPHRVLRNPLTREVLGELLPRTRRDSPTGQELRAMARRAKLLIE